MVKMSKCIECGVNEIDVNTKGFCSEKCKNINSWKESNYQMDINYVICPYCDARHDGDNIYKLVDNIQTTIVCEVCCKKFIAKAEVSTIFISMCLTEYYEELNGWLANE